jgi:hypothetical protein
MELPMTRPEAVALTVMELAYALRFPALVLTVFGIGYILAWCVS